MPEPESAAGGVYCKFGCHEVRPKYAVPRVKAWKPATNKKTEPALHFK
jgi:hypothetical protein